MRKVCALFLVVMLLMPFGMTVQAEEMTVDDLQENIDNISDLIRLIRYARENGDDNAVMQFQGILASMGVDCLDGDEIAALMDAEGLSFSADASTASDDLPGIPVVVDRPSLDWYVYHSVGYYYPEIARSYDVYVLLASPKNSASYLRKNGRFNSVDETKVFFSNVNGIVGDAALQVGAEVLGEVSGYDTVFTIMDILSEAFDGVEPYTIEEIGVGAWTVIYTLDATLSYIYIRETNTLDDYTLAMYGNQIELDYSYIQLVEANMGNGATDENTSTLTSVSVISKPTYNNYKEAIRNFRSGMVANNFIEDVQIVLFDNQQTVREEINVAIPSFSYPEGVYSIPGKDDDLI